MKSTLFAILLCLMTQGARGQSIFRIDSLSQQGVSLDKGWKWQLGNNPAWSRPDFEDARWDTLNPSQNISALTKLPRQGIGWLRIRLEVAAQLRGKQIALNVRQSGAAELFLNGKLTWFLGKINNRKQVGVGITNSYEPFIRLSNDSVQVIAIRYAYATDRLLQKTLPFFNLDLLMPEVAEKQKMTLAFYTSLAMALFSIFLVLGVLQLLLYVSATEQRATLYLGLFLVAQSITHLSDWLEKNSELLSKTYSISEIAWWYDLNTIIFESAIALSAFFYLLGIYTYFRQPKGLLFFVVATISLATAPAGILLTGNDGYLALFVLGFVLPWSEILRIGILALKQKRSGARLFTLVHSLLLGVFIVYTLAVFIPSFGVFLASYGINDLFTVSFLGLALIISLLLSQERAETNKLLQKQLVELEALAQKTLAQEQEKQQLLATQNERLEQQVEVRTAELKASQAQLIQKEKLASLGELTAGIAHEIQNPLNFVNNFSEVSTELVEELKEGSFQKLPQLEKAYAEEILGDLSSNLQKIHHHGGRASSIVKGMLEHARTESGEKRLTNLNALADEYLKIAYHGLRAKDKSFNCELITQFDPTLKPIEVAPQEIGRVLLNLYNNAFYAVGERARQRNDPDYKPTVEVTTQHQPGEVVLQVRDNGTGIPDSVKDKIFQPFFTTKPTGEGTGLGLSLSYDIVTKSHPGSLTLTSRLGEGTAFTIRLPA